MDTDTVQASGLMGDLYCEMERIGLIELSRGEPVTFWTDGTPNAWVRQAQESLAEWLKTTEGQAHLARMARVLELRQRG